MLELKCSRSSSDRIIAEPRPSRTPGVMLASHNWDGEQVTVFADPDNVRTFAYGLLELIGEAKPEPEAHAAITPAARLQALTDAREHVDNLATNKNGYRDGANFNDREAAVRRVAAFLLGEDA